MKAFINDFRETVERSAAVLMELSEADSARRPAPGKWSPKEIIGHLIDILEQGFKSWVCFAKSLYSPARYTGTVHLRY